LRNGGVVEEPEYILHLAGERLLPFSFRGLGKIERELLRFPERVVFINPDAFELGEAKLHILVAFRKDRRLEPVRRRAPAGFLNGFEGERFQLLGEHEHGAGKNKACEDETRDPYGDESLDTSASECSRHGGSAQGSAEIQFQFSPLDVEK
jgi:hypothetical protein